MAKLTAEQLVIEAERRKVGKPIDQGYLDNKANFGVEAILTLIEEGAAVAGANSRISGPAYHTEVIYMGYRFMALTEKPIERLNM